MVTRIAVDTGFPPEVVRESYLAALAELSADASVHIYLPLFAAKRTIARLRSAKSESANQTHSSNLDAARDEVLSGTQVAFAATSHDCPHPRPQQTPQRQVAALA